MKKEEYDVKKDVKITDSQIENQVNNLVMKDVKIDNEIITPKEHTKIKNELEPSDNIKDETNKTISKDNNIQKDTNVIDIKKEVKEKNPNEKKPKKSVKKDKHENEKREPKDKTENKDKNDDLKRKRTPSEHISNSIHNDVTSPKTPVKSSSPYPSDIISPKPKNTYKKEDESNQPRNVPDIDEISKM